ncbi:hypothetical protein V2J09_000505 [Rumex salicifolius]
MCTYLTAPSSSRKAIEIFIGGPFLSFCFSVVLPQTPLKSLLAFCGSFLSEIAIDSQPVFMLYVGCAVVALLVQEKISTRLVMLILNRMMVCRLGVSFSKGGSEEAEFQLQEIYNGLREGEHLSCARRIGYSRRSWAATRRLMPLALTSRTIDEICWHTLSLSTAFFFEYDVDACDCLTRLFWADPIFGDIVWFAATYRTNR